MDLRSWKRPLFARGLSSLIALAACLAPARGIPKGSEKWIQVDTPNFRIFSNAGNRSAIQAGTELERLREVLSKMAGGLSVNSPVPTLVYVFKDESSFRGYTPIRNGRATNIAGYFGGERDANYVAMNAADRDSATTIIYHEYLHYFLNNNFPKVPLWFNEGFAEFYSTFRCHGSRAEIGHVNVERLRTLRQLGFMPLRELVVVNEQSRDYNEGLRQGMFYAESWALVHYFFMGSAERKSQIAEYLDLLATGTASDDAFQSAFRASYEEVEKELRSYITRGAFPFGVIALPDLQADHDFRVVALSREDTLCHLGDLLAHMGPDRLEEAEQHFKAALESTPDHAAALAGIGWLRDRQGHPDEAAAFYEKAVQADPVEPLFRLLYGENLMERYRKGAVGPTDLSQETARLQAREQFRKCIELGGGRVEAYAGLGSTFTNEKTGLEEGIAALEKGRRLAPFRTDLTLNLALLYQRQGEFDRARPLLEEVIARGEDPGMIEAAREALLREELSAVQGLLEAGKLDVAIEGLTRLSARTKDPALRTQLDEQIIRVREGLERNRLSSLLTQASTLMTEGSYDRAGEIAEQVRGEAKDAEIGKAASDLLEAIRNARAARKKHR